MLNAIGAIHKYVIEIDNYISVKEEVKYLSRQSHEGTRSIR